MWNMLLPALISGGTNLLSGLLNPAQDNRSHNLAVSKANRRRIALTNKREIRWNRQVEAKARQAGTFMMEEANRLGINPVVYLQNGGLSHAFNVATVGLSKPSFVAYQRPEEAYTQSGMTTGQAIGSGLEAFGSSFATSLRQEAQNNFSRELLQLQLEAANKRGNSSGMSLGGVPTAALFGGGGSPHLTSTNPVGTVSPTTLGGGVSIPAGDMGTIKLPWTLTPEQRKLMEDELGDFGSILVPALVLPGALQQPETVDTTFTWLDRVSQTVDLYVQEGIRRAMLPQNRGGVSFGPGWTQPWGGQTPSVNRDDPVFNEGFWQ